MGSDNQDITGSYFVGMCKLKSKAWTDMEMEEAPTELDTVNISGGFAVVLPDRLSVRYSSAGLQDDGAFAVQANRPAPVKQLVYYFEMFVKNHGAQGCVAIGFTCEGYDMRRLPGWDANSYGYHGDNGHLYHGKGTGEEFGPTYATGDTVGGGINYATQELFFTKNGVVVGTVYKDVKVPLYPTVAVHSKNEEVSVNFGKEPFRFDLKAYEAQLTSLLFLSPPPCLVRWGGVSLDSEKVAVLEKVKEVHPESLREPDGCGRSQPFLHFVYESLFQIVTCLRQLKERPLIQSDLDTLKDLVSCLKMSQIDIRWAELLIEKADSQERMQILATELEFLRGRLRDRRDLLDAKRARLHELVAEVSRDESDVKELEEEVRVKESDLEVSSLSLADLL